MFEFERNDELEVIWSGRMELLPPRPTKPSDTWQPPRRLYNKNGKDGDNSEETMLTSSQGGDDNDADLEVEDVRSR